MGKMIARLGRWIRRRAAFALSEALRKDNSETWTLTANLAAQAVARVLPAELGGDVARPLADVAAVLLPYGVGRLVSKIVKGPLVGPIE